MTFKLKNIKLCDRRKIKKLKRKYFYIEHSYFCYDWFDEEFHLKDDVFADMIYVNKNDDDIPNNVYFPTYISFKYDPNYDPEEENEYICYSFYKDRNEYLKLKLKNG